jgi:hypothetical protein
VGLGQNLLLLRPFVGKVIFLELLKVFLELINLGVLAYGFLIKGISELCDFLIVGLGQNLLLLRPFVGKVIFLELLKVFLELINLGVLAYGFLIKGISELCDFLIVGLGQNLLLLRPFVGKVIFLELLKVFLELINLGVLAYGFLIKGISELCDFLIVGLGQNLLLLRPFVGKVIFLELLKVFLELINLGVLAYGFLIKGISELCDFLIVGLGQNLLLLRPFVGKVIFLELLKVFLELINLGVLAYGFLIKGISELCDFLIVGLGQNLLLLRPFVGKVIFLELLKVFLELINLGVLAYGFLIKRISELCDFLIVGLGQNLFI